MAGTFLKRTKEKKCPHCGSQNINLIGKAATPAQINFENRPDFYECLEEECKEKFIFEKGEKL